MVGQTIAGLGFPGALHKATVRGVPDGLIHLAQVGFMRQLRIVQTNAVG